MLLKLLLENVELLDLVEVLSLFLLQALLDLLLLVLKLCNLNLHLIGLRLDLLGVAAFTTCLRLQLVCLVLKPSVVPANALHLVAQLHNNVNQLL